MIEKRSGSKSTLPERTKESSVLYSILSVVKSLMLAKELTKNIGNISSKKIKIRFEFIIENNFSKA